MRIAKWAGVWCAVISLTAVACGDQNGGNAGVVAQGEVAEEVSSRDVAWAHEQLKAMGYFPNEALVDEYPGWQPVIATPPSDETRLDASSRAALRMFQTHRGLDASGLLDPATLEAMDGRLCGVPESSVTDEDKWAIGGNAFPKLTTTFPTWVLFNDDDSISYDDARVAIWNTVLKWYFATDVEMGEWEEGDSGEPELIILFSPISAVAKIAPVGLTPQGTNQYLLTLNSAVTWTSTQIAGALLHEFGHFIGLHHSSAINASMYSFNNNLFGTTAPTVLGSDDVVPANAMYGEWEFVPGTQALDIGVGKPHQVWVVSNTRVNGGYAIKRRNSNGIWTTVPGGATRIDVDSGGNPWIVTATGAIYRKRLGDACISQPAPACWTQFAGCALDIGAGQDGSVWIVGCNAVNGGNDIYKFNPTPLLGQSNWTLVSGGAFDIDVDASGRPWIRTGTTSLYRRNGNAWELLPGLGYDIGLGGSNVQFVGTRHYPWLIATSDVPGGHPVYTFSEEAQVGAVNSASEVPARKKWEGTNGGAGTRISADTNGRAWITTNTGSIYRRAPWPL